MSRPVRRFCFTLNNYTDDDVEKCKRFLQENAKYGIFGLEVAPSTGTKHIQGFCNCKKPIRFGAIKAKINNALHIEKANGTDEQNKQYCSKGDNVFETGTPSKQGNRTDLQSLVDTIQNGERDLAAIAIKHPTSFIRYHRGIRTYLDIAFPVSPRNFKTEVYYYWGPPGSGKSRRANREATEKNGDSIYYKPRGIWWDGYRQQECVVIDDFYGWIKYDELLKICDRYPYKVQVKGGFEEFKAKYIWITSNCDTDQLYHFSGFIDTAFCRRITNKEYIA